GAMFATEPDPETNFKLFGPIAFSSEVGTGSSEENASKANDRLRGIQGTSRAFALRLRPNQDFAGALEAFCRERGIIHAKLHGGVGSTIGARFTDGRVVEPFATELAVSSGVVAPGAGGAREAKLDIARVDY